MDMYLQILPFLVE